MGEFGFGRRSSRNLFIGAEDEEIKEYVEKSEEPIEELLEESILPEEPLEIIEDIPLPHHDVIFSENMPNDRISSLIDEVWLQTQTHNAPQKAKKYSYKKSTGEINFLDGSRKHKFNAKLFALKKQRVFSQLAMFALVLVIASGIFEGSLAIARAMIAKSEVLGATTQGLQSLSQGMALASNKQFTDSQEQFDLAKGYFLQGQIDLKADNNLVAGLISSTPQGQDAKKILTAGNNLAQAGTDLTQFYALSKGINVDATGFHTPDGLYQTLNAVNKYLDDAHNQMQSASDLLSSVDPNIVPASYREQLVKSTQEVQVYAQALEQMNEMMSLVQAFFGPGPKTVLVLFENNNELRPGGGFIGTYGLFKLNNGVITQQKIDSIYNIDGQLKSKIAPPGEFHNLTDSWQLRDSNWFADFKDSAKKVSDFYELEGQETPDAVVAITPDLFEDILNITGPINFPKYNVTLNAQNFRDTIQLGTSDKQSNTPKQMLADFSPLLMQSISKLSPDSNKQLLNALLDNLQRKNIMVYDRNPDVEQTLQNYNWAGTLFATDKDYLSVSAANLGGGKTDLNINQSMNLSSQVQVDNSIVNTITYTRSHKDVLTDPKNISYVRFFVPAGSQLLSATGFSSEPYYKSDGSAYASFEKQSSFKYDDELAAIDSGTKVDKISGTVIDNEDGKTAFGNWMETNPGESQTITLTYKLPYTFDSQSNSLIVQKQPGATDMDLNYSFTAATGAKPLSQLMWYTPYSSKFENGSFEVEQLINTDSFFGVVFDHPNK